MTSVSFVRRVDHEVELDVLFVCTGNICRSPLAAALLRHVRPDLRIRSSGLGAVVGARMDAVPAALARERGADPAHAARQFSVREALGSALVLVMERSQRDRVLDEAPRLLRRTFTLLEFLAATERSPAPMPVTELTGVAARQRAAGREAPDVEDPFRRSEATHRAVATTLADSIDALAARIER